ncbi:hypothetical protein ACO0LO_18270 [Undibacterium sp. TJN25]|uniref:hypothetical protein n=1 Tax=Undibacterium sp. TJN25 TaxID=3413056 RepID=UPI003BF1E4FD
MTTQAASSFSSQRRVAALAIAGVTALVLVALSHHPVVSHPSSVQDMLIQIAAQQQMDGLVHGGLIALLGILACGFSVFSDVLGARRAPVSFARAAYVLGYCAMVGAMLLDGFVTPQLARQFSNASAVDIASVHVVLNAISDLIQVLSKAGLLAMCAALIAWAWALYAGERPTRWYAWCAGLGMLAGLLPALFLLLAQISLAPVSLMVIFGLHAVWNFAAAGLLFDVRRNA